MAHFENTGIPKELHNDITAILGKHKMSDVLAAIADGDYWEMINGANVPNSDKDKAIDALDAATTWALRLE